MADARFQLNDDSASRLLEAHQQTEEELDRLEKEVESVHHQNYNGGMSDSSSTSSKEEAVVAQKNNPQQQPEQVDASSSVDDDSSDDSSSSSSDSISDSSEEEGDEELVTASTMYGDNSSRKVGSTNDAPRKNPNEDDFLVEEGITTNDDVFANAKNIPALDSAAGDKSQGWATQRQLPRQYNSKRRKR
jgi:hypothetical protein